MTSYWYRWKANLVVTEVADKNLSKQVMTISYTQKHVNFDCRFLLTGMEIHGQEVKIPK